MNAREIEAAIVAELQHVVDGRAAPKVSELRARLACSLGELRQVIASMRMKGKLRWDELRLSPSMLEDPASAAVTPQESASTAVVQPEPEPKAQEPAPQPIADQVRAEALQNGKRRRIARCTGRIHPVDLSLPERIQTEMAAEPQDLIKAIHRRHPSLWARSVQLSRQLAVLPATALYQALELGLDALERKELGQ